MIPVSPLMVVVMVDTTAAVGGGAAVVTTRDAGRQFLQLPSQIPNLIQQTAHTKVMMIVRNAHTITIPAIMPATEETTHMIT